MDTFKKLIVFFLTCNSVLLYTMDLALEKKGEFINRTQKLPCSGKFKHNNSYYFIEPQGAELGYYVNCPYNKNHALLRPAEETVRTAQLVVLNSQLQVYARQFLGYKKFFAIALSAQRDLFATVHEEPQHEILKIRRIDTKKTLKKYKIPTYFEIASVFTANPARAYNKQGTDVIVWGVDVRKGKSYTGSVYGVPALDYMIVNFQEELNSEKIRK